MRAQAVSCFGSCTLSQDSVYTKRSIVIHYPYKLCSVLPTHNIGKSQISSSEDVPIHSLAYRPPRTPLPRH